MPMMYAVRIVAYYILYKGALAMEKENASVRKLLEELARQSSEQGGASALDDEVRRLMSWKSAGEREQLVRQLIRQLEEQK